MDEHLETPGGGMRTYADFARRSPIPAREDHQVTTPRNSPPLVNASLPRPGGLLLHFDGEFSTATDLVKDTFAGRNFGWLLGERAIAVTHLARIIRQDDGTGELAQEFGGLPYAIVLAGTDPSIPEEFRLPEAFRISMASASDRDLFEGVARLVAAYTDNLVFSRDERGEFNLSPYDVFLQINGLPRQPFPREAPVDHSRRLLRLIEKLERDGGLAWVTEKPRRHRPHRHHRRARFVKSNPHTEDGRFKFHDQPFIFGRRELQGLKVFSREPQGFRLHRRNWSEDRSAIASPATKRRSSRILASITPEPRRKSTTAFTGLAPSPDWIFRTCASEMRVMIATCRPRNNTPRLAGRSELSRRRAIPS